MISTYTESAHIHLGIKHTDTQTWDLRQHTGTLSNLIRLNITWTWPDSKPGTAWPARPVAQRNYTCRWYVQVMVILASGVRYLMNLEWSWSHSWSLDWEQHQGNRWDVCRRGTTVFSGTLWQMHHKGQSPTVSAWLPVCRSGWQPAHLPVCLCPLPDPVVQQCMLPPPHITLFPHNIWHE